MKVEMVTQKVVKPKKDGCQSFIFLLKIDLVTPDFVSE